MISFEKWHGLGNDFILIDATANPSLIDSVIPSCTDMCDRRRGIGSDGIIFASKSAAAATGMRMFNPDGSESEMCGNGIRCFALFLKRANLVQDVQGVTVETGAGILTVWETATGEVRVDMGPADFNPTSFVSDVNRVEPMVQEEFHWKDRVFTGTAVSMGNPHLVLFESNIENLPLSEIGPAFERDPRFKNGINVHFAEVNSRTEAKQRTWERGAGITLACGTGACAVAAAGVRLGLLDPLVQVHLPGGTLGIEARPGENAFMTGPATYVFSGSFELDSRQSFGYGSRFHF